MNARPLKELGPQIANGPRPYAVEPLLSIVRFICEQNVLFHFFVNLLPRSLAVLQQVQLVVDVGINILVAAPSQGVCPPVSPVWASFKLPCPWMHVQPLCSMLALVIGLTASKYGSLYRISFSQFTSGDLVEYPNLTVILHSGGKLEGTVKQNLSRVTTLG